MNIIKVINVFVRSITSKETVAFKCAKCKFTEDIPKGVVDYFDKIDKGDKSIPPRFNCQFCNALMKPIHYVNRNGIIYKYNK